MALVFPSKLQCSKLEYLLLKVSIPEILYNKRVIIYHITRFLQIMALFWWDQMKFQRLIKAY